MWARYHSAKLQPAATNHNQPQPQPTTSNQNQPHPTRTNQNQPQPATTNLQLNVSFWWNFALCTLWFGSGTETTGSESANIVVGIKTPDLIRLPVTNGRFWSPLKRYVSPGVQLGDLSCDRLFGALLAEITPPTFTWFDMFGTNVNFGRVRGYRTCQQNILQTGPQRREGEPAPLIKISSIYTDAMLSSV